MAAERRAGLHGKTPKLGLSRFAHQTVVQQAHNENATNHIAEDFRHQPALVSNPGHAAGNHQGKISGAVSRLVSAASS
jgi:hypothetical protein